MNRNGLVEEYNKQLIIANSVHTDELYQLLTEIQGVDATARSWPCPSPTFCEIKAAFKTFQNYDNDKQTTEAMPTFGHGCIDKQCRREEENCS